MNRKLMGVVAAVVLALTGTILLVSYVNGAEDRALAGEKTVRVLVVAQAIKQGTPADALDGKVELKRVPAKVRASDAVSDLGALHGLVTTGDLVPGEQVITARFAKSSAVPTPGRPGASSSVDTSSLLKVSLALDSERVVGGRLRAGDTVAVFVSTEDPKQTHLLLHQISVVGVQGSGSSSTSDNAKKTSGNTSAAKLIVTLALAEPPAENLVWALEHGTVWLAIEPQSADQSGTRIVTDQNALQ